MRESREWDTPETNSRRVNTSHNKMRPLKIKTGNRRQFSLAKNKDLMNLKDNVEKKETLEEKSRASIVTHNNIITANHVVVNYDNNGAIGLSSTTRRSN